MKLTKIAKIDYFSDVTPTVLFGLTKPYKSEAGYYCFGIIINGKCFAIGIKF